MFFTFHFCIPFFLSSVTQLLWWIAHFYSVFFVPPLFDTDYPSKAPWQSSKGGEKTPQQCLFFQTQFRACQRREQSFLHPLPVFMCSSLTRSLRQNKVNHRNNLRTPDKAKSIYMSMSRRDKRQEVLNKAETRLVTVYTRAIWYQASSSNYRRLSASLFEMRSLTVDDNTHWARWFARRRVHSTSLGQKDAGGSDKGRVSYHGLAGCLRVVVAGWRVSISHWSSSPAEPGMGRWGVGGTLGVGFWQFFFWKMI